MRPFEILLLFLTVAAALGVLVGKKSRRVGLVALALLVAHVLVEGLRWQMLPALALLLLLSSRAWTRRGRGHEPESEPESESDEELSAARGGAVRRLSGCLTRWLLLPVATLVAVFIPSAMLVPDFPTPTGPYAVGVTDFAVSFDDRPEIMTQQEDDVREIAVRAWYPAEATEGMPTPYMTEQEFQGFINAFGSSVPAGNLVFSGAQLARTNAYRDAPIASADRGFPVLQFSHGYTGFTAQNTPLMEHLASHGYVVFSIAHTYDGSVVFPDGRVEGMGEHIQRWMAQTMEDPATMMAQLETLVRGSDPDARNVVLDEMADQARRDKEAGLGVGVSWDVWVADRMDFLDVVEELQSGDRPSAFQGRLDLSRIGMLGMSFGGATAAEACHLEPRCKAAVNLDGGHMYAPDSELRDGHIAKPLLMIHASDVTSFRVPSPDNIDDFQAYNDFFYEPIDDRGRRTDVIRIRVDGTSHVHLTDLSLMVRWIPIYGSRTPGPRIAEILNRYSLAFFDETLRGRSAQLLDGPTEEFPEVSFQSFGGPLPRAGR